MGKNESAISEYKDKLIYFNGGRNKVAFITGEHSYITGKSGCFIARITEIAKINKGRFHVRKDITELVSKNGTIEGFTSETNKAKYGKYIGSMSGYVGDLTFVDQTYPLTIKQILDSDVVSFKLVSIWKIKAHLVAERALVDTNKSKALEFECSDLAKLEGAADANFMRDYLICKEDVFPLSTEIMAMIGSFVDGGVKVSDKEHGAFEINVESYNPPWMIETVALGIKEGWDIGSHLDLGPNW